MNAVFGLMNSGRWSQNRGENLLDGGAHFYGTYQCADEKWISIGSIEPQFYQLLLEKTGLINDTDLPKQMDREKWPLVKEKLVTVFASKSRDAWDEIMLGTDICYAPVLDFDEATAHPHNVARQTFVESHGVTQAAPAPRFSRTTPELPGPSVAPGSHTNEILAALGISEADINALVASGAVA